MDGGIAAIIVGLVGVVGTLGGTIVGGRATVSAANVTSVSSRETARLEARRDAFVALGAAAFLFGRKIVDVQQILDRRWAGSGYTHSPVPAEEYLALDARLDEVAHTAIQVQLHGPNELVDLAWDVYAACVRAERKLASYAITRRSETQRSKEALTEALSQASRARGIFLSNGRAHLEGESVPLQREPTLRTSEDDAID